MLPADERAVSRTDPQKRQKVQSQFFDFRDRGRTVQDVCARSAGQLPGVGAYGLRRVLGRNVFAFAGGAGRPGRIRGSGEAALCVDGEGIRRKAHGFSQYRTDLFGSYRRSGRFDGVPHDVGRRRQARSGMEKSELRLCQCDRPEAAPAAAEFQAERRYRVPFFRPGMVAVAADGREIRELAEQSGTSGRGDQPVYGLRDVRGASEGRQRDL